MKCPKCSYERQPSDDAPEWQCPACKVAYAKVLQAQAAVTVPVEPPRLAQTEALPDEDALHEQHWLAAKGQKMVIYSILLNFLHRAFEQAQVLPVLVTWALLIGIAVYAITGVVKICSGLCMTQNQKILFMVLAFMPLINLISLVYLNVKASKMLRAAGWSVGLLGARP